MRPLTTWNEGDTVENNGPPIKISWVGGEAVIPTGARGEVVLHPKGDPHGALHVRFDPTYATDGQGLFGTWVFDQWVRAHQLIKVVGQ